ncbi:MAG: hypothetical protein ACJAVD_001186 [Porticoccaceae bacterium]|jgi:hypothetical protein
MIKFFRKIRYDLMEKNKTGKYLKYAIGEVILVVIGILIALQINNANELLKSKNIKQNYYIQIAADLDKEIENINARVIYLDTCITTLDRYWETVARSNLAPKKIIKELSKVKNSFRWLAFNTNTIQTLESTGDIKLMPTQIRNALIDLKQTQEQIFRVAKGNYEIYLNSAIKGQQLGFHRIVDKKTSLGVENNIPEIILTIEGGLILKDLIDKHVKEILLEMLTTINKIKELIALDLQ